ncbi:MAG: reverse transcriptase family protein [Cyanobacteria bacterium J06582_2]
MCLHPIPVLSPPRWLRRHWVTPRCRDPSNLIYPTASTQSEQVVVTGGLWNCQSAVPKAEFISGYASSLSLNFLALTETWITPENTATPAALSDVYSFSHTPRAVRRGGGTGLLISPKWKYSPFTIPQFSPPSFEFHAVSVTYPVKLTIVVLYRPPGPLGEFLEELDTLVSHLPDDGTALILLGDFNIQSEKVEPLLSFLSAFDLRLSSSPPTHKAGNQLDLIFTKHCSTPNLSVTPLHLSDHYFMSYSLSLPPSSATPPPTHMVTTRSHLRTLSPSDLSSAVSSALPAPESFSLLPSDTATDLLLSTLSSSLDSLCPLTSRPARPSPPAPWLSDQVRTDRRSLRTAERKWRRGRLPEDLLNFQSLLSTFSSSLSAAKSAFFRTKILNSASNPKKLFQTFSSLLKPPPPTPNSSLLPNDFANFFDKKVNDIRSSFPPPPANTRSTHLTPPSPSTPSPPPPPALSHFSPLSPNEVLNLVTSNRPTTCSLDPVPSTLLQSVAPELLPFLAHLINASLASGCFPSAFKTARVTPLLKKPSLDPSDVKNYRPVSLLSFLSKTLERAIFNQLCSYLHQNNLLDPYQSGFKAGHSTETALLAVTESLHAARVNSLSSVLILLDLSAAFDTVDHQILLSTLEEKGVTGSALSLFASYLTGRSYQVTWRGTMSEPRSLTTGVPQGSVLGPLLFSLYTTSLGSVISSHGFSYHCYADDTQLVLSFPPSDTQVETRIAGCLADISEWMMTHHLKLNLDKTELLFLPGKGCPHRDLAITIEDTVVTPTRTARNLGVTLDDQLSFSAHISSVTRSCRFMLYNIRKIRPFLTAETAQVLIQALVISRLDYCNSLLAGIPAAAIKPLELIQKAAARLVFNQPKFTHTTSLLRSLHWLPVAARIQFKTLMLAYRAMKGTAPSYLQAMVKPYTPSRPLRSATSGRLVAPSLRGTCGRSTRSRLFSVLAPQWWNELPTDVRTAESLPIFRRRLKTTLFKKYYNDSPSL